jgi:hypothetical protein
MSLLTRDDILKAEDLATEDVAVPEWGGTVRLRTLTGAERDKFEASTVQMKGNKATQNMANFRARLVSLCIIDEDGNRQFGQADVAALGAKSAAALQRLFNKCSEMNGMSEKDVEDLTEGFDEAQNESSSFD